MNPPITHSPTDEALDTASTPAALPHGATPAVADAALLAVISADGVAQDDLSLTAIWRFLRASWLQVLAVSGAILAPCFWHRHIEAGDLASHTYNAWLAQLIVRGQAPGLWLARQSQNVLFDLMLCGLGNAFGLRSAERIAVSACVLIFFWGAFALVSAVTGRLPWNLVPALAMLTYGWTFEQGLLNYYLAIGLAFFAIAIVARGRGWERALALLLVPFVWMAHPLGLILLGAVSAYLPLAQRLSVPKRWLFFAGATVVVLLARFYLSTHYAVLWTQGGLSAYLRMYNGADQLALYGTRYRVLANLFLAFLAFCVLADVALRRAEKSLAAGYSLPLQLYGVALVAGYFLPSAVFLTQYAAPASLLTDRLTSVTAILACCLFGVAKPKSWHLVGFAALALVFFSFLYVDTGNLDRMESQAERYVRVIPPGQRILVTIWPFRGSRILTSHVADRACIGQCFSYGNYEPASRQFRVRANPGNPFVLTTYESTGASEGGEYVIQPTDLPVFQIYQCNLNMTELCMLELRAGEVNGIVGVHPDRPQR